MYYYYNYDGHSSSSIKFLIYLFLLILKIKLPLTPWEKVVSFEKTKRGKRRQKLIRKLKSTKDERTVPISKALYEAIKDITLIKGSDDPIWANRYKENDDS